MPSFFQFTQGTESRVRLTSDSSPLLGRFRAVPSSAPHHHHHHHHGQRRISRQRSQLGLLANGRGSVHVGYGAFLGTEGNGHANDEDDEDDDSSDDGVERSAWERWWKRWVMDVWVHPRQLAVKRIVEKWYSRYGLLVLLPALLVSGRLRLGMLGYRKHTALFVLYDLGT